MTEGRIEVSIPKARPASDTPPEKKQVPDTKANCSAGQNCGRAQGYRTQGSSVVARSVQLAARQGKRRFERDPDEAVI